VRKVLSPDGGSDLTGARVTEMTRGCSTAASLPTNLPASCEARRRLALSRRSLPLGCKTVGLRTIPGREVKAVSKNPAHSEPHAGSGTTQALPVHPWSRRWGYRRGGSGRLQIIRRGFAGLSIRDNVIRDFLSLVEAVHPGALDGANVHENILAAVIRLDEAKAFLAVEPLYGSLRHETLLSVRV